MPNEARVIQSAVKVIVSGGPPPEARVIQSAVKLIVIPGAAEARVIQSAVKLIALPVPTPPPPTPTPGAAPAGIASAQGAWDAASNKIRIRGRACNAFMIWNDYDSGLKVEQDAYTRINFPDPWSCAIPEEYRSITPWDEDALALPPQAQHLRKTTAITTPTTASGDNIVVQVQCPLGYDALLTAVVFSYSGTGFVQGSGDLVFRVRINQHFPKDLGAVPFQWGTPRYPFPLEQGLVFYSGQVMQGIVNVPNSSGSIQIGASLIVMGLFGFYWTRGIKTYALPSPGMPASQ